MSLTVFLFPSSACLSIGVNKVSHFKSIVIVTILQGGPLPSVVADVATIRNSGVSLGLHLNPLKSQVISHSEHISHLQFDGFHLQTPRRPFADSSRPGRRAVKRV